jgi:hypothetical protein
VSSQHPFLKSYKSGQAFSEILERSFHDLDLSKDIKGVQAAKDEGSATHISIQDDIKFIKGLRKEIRNDQKPEVSAAPNVPSSVKGKAKTVANVPSRRMIQWQMARLRIYQESLFASAQQLIDQFVLKHYPHPLLRKYWGALDAINQV